METPDREAKHYAEIGFDPDGVTRKAYTDTQVKVEDEDSRRITFTITTGAVDRDNDTIKVDGWDLANYRKNPVVLWAHRSDQLPVAKTVSIVKSGGALKATAEFATAEMNPVAESVYQMLKAGFLKATSVGFRPKRDKWAWNEERGGVDFQEQELLEYSVVPVPSNPEALMALGKDFAGAKSAGIDIEPIRKALALADVAVATEPVAPVAPAVEKAGRRLSSKTEASLRSAHKSATEAVEHLSAVLEVAEEQMDEDDKSTPVLFVTPSPATQAPVYAVNPDDVKAAVVAAVSATVQAEVNRMRGRLD